MFKKINWKYTFISAVIASLLFSICAFIFIKNADYTSSWVLYLGGILFFFTMAIATVKESNNRGGNESTIALSFASIVTTLLGIILSLFFCFTMLMIMDSGFLLSMPAAKVLQHAPPDTIHGKTGGLALKVFASATLLCFFGGSIAALTMPYYVKRNQTKDDKEPTPFQQKKTDDTNKG